MTEAIKAWKKASVNFQEINERTQDIALFTAKIAAKTFNPQQKINLFHSTFCRSKKDCLDKRVARGHGRKFIYHICKFDGTCNMQTPWRKEAQL